MRSEGADDRIWDHAASKDLVGGGGAVVRRSKEALRRGCVTEQTLREYLGPVLTGFARVLEMRHVRSTCRQRLWRSALEAASGYRMETSTDDGALNVGRRVRNIVLFQVN